MPTMTLTITNVPGFSAVGVGYKFTGTVNLPQVVDGAIRFNSMRLYYGKGRTYKVAPYLTAQCGDTTFRTDYFTISDTGTSSVKERDMNILSWQEGEDHLLRRGGRLITFTVARDEATSSNVIDRPYGGDMTLTVDYTPLGSTLTLDKDRVEAGESIRAAITAGDAAYAHKLTFTAGSRTHTLELQPGVSAATFTIPREWLSEIPRQTEMAAAAALDTYAGETLMGSESASFTITCPADIVPSCQLTVQPRDGFNGLYLSGRSRAELTITNEQSLYGAQVVGYRLTGAGYDQALKTASFGPLPQGEHTFTAVVTDTRGRIGRARATVTVLPYAAPSLGGIAVFRADDRGQRSDEGAYIRVEASPVFSSLEGANAAVTEVRYRQTSGGWSDWEAFTGGALLGGGLLASLSYEAQICVTDAVGNSASHTQRIPTSRVAFNIREGGTAAAFGRYAESDRRLSIPEDWRFFRGETDIEAALEARLQNLVTLKEVTDALYPVGAVYLSFAPQSPAERFGGEWEQLRERFLLAASETILPGDTGGEAQHTLTLSELPAHSHKIANVKHEGVSADTLYGNYPVRLVGDKASNWGAQSVNAAGGDAPHNNMPPYVAVYMWRRTA